MPHVSLWLEKKALYCYPIVLPCSAANKLRQPRKLGAAEIYSAETPKLMLIGAAAGIEKVGVIWQPRTSGTRTQRKNG
jgi:hypothetical protein